MRRSMGKTIRGWRGVATAAFMIMAVGLSACGDESVTDANTSAALGDSEASAILSDMTGDLGLTDDQKSELLAIAQDYATRMGEPGVTWYAAADVQAVLTSEQITQIAARRQQLRERIADRMTSAGVRGQRGDSAGVRGRGMRRGGGRGGIGGGPWAGLDLSQEQIDAIQDVLEKYRPQLEAVRDQVRDGSLTREEARDQVGPIRDAIRTEIEALLTPEQLAAIDDRKMDRENAREEAQAAKADALGLTAQQQAQIDALRDAPKTEGTREELREAHRAALEAILTDEQLEIVAVHEALRGHGMLRRFSGGQGFGGGEGDRPGRHGGFGRGFGGGS